MQFLGVCKNKADEALGTTRLEKGFGYDEPSTSASPQLTVWTNGFTTSSCARLAWDCSTTLNPVSIPFVRSREPLHTLSLSRRHSAHATTSVRGFKDFVGGTGGIVPNLSGMRTQRSLSKLSVNDSRDLHLISGPTRIKLRCRRGKSWGN